MSNVWGASRSLWLRSAALAVGAVQSRSSAPAGARSRRGCGTVTLNEQAWAGSTANTYVAKAVLESSAAR